MPKLNISQAARAAGVTRRTFYRHIESGKVTVEIGQDGNRLIDLSEMHRVYGALKSVDTPLHSDNGETGIQHDTGAVTPIFEDHIASLKAEVESLKHELDDKKEEGKKLIEIIDRQTRMITYQASETSPVPEPSPDPEVEKLKRQVAKLNKQNSYFLHMQRRSWWEKLMGKKYVAPSD